MHKLTSLIFLSTYICYFKNIVCKERSYHGPTPNKSIPPFSNQGFWLLAQTSIYLLTRLHQPHLRNEMARGYSTFCLNYFPSPKEFQLHSKSLPIVISWVIRVDFAFLVQTHPAFPLHCRLLVVELWSPVSLTPWSLTFALDRGPPSLYFHLLFVLWMGSFFFNNKVWQAFILILVRIHLLVGTGEPPIANAHEYCPMWILSHVDRTCTFKGGRLVVGGGGCKLSLANPKVQTLKWSKTW
jgi:hypothetical protein